jgi:ACS family glucarate transporter-like MFS transporter
VASSPDPTDRPPSRPIAWRIFALACGASFLLYLHRYSWNIVGETVRQDFGFSHKQAGFLFSLFYYTYALGQIPAGVFIDRFGPHLFLSVAIVAWSVALAAIGRSSTPLRLGACRLLFGMAQAGCYPALNKITRIWFEPARRTVIQGWVATTAGRTGGAMAPIVLATLLIGAFSLSWQASLMLLGVAGIAFGLLFGWIYRDPPLEPSATGVEAGRAATAARSTLPAGRAWRNVSLRFFTLQQFLDAGSDVAYVSLIGSYFLNGRGFAMAKTGWLASLPLWGGALGGIVGGWLNDRVIAWTGSRRWSRSGVGCVGKLIGGALLTLVVRQSDGETAAWFLFAAKFFSDWSQPTAWGTCTDLGGRYSATVFSIINTAGTLGGIVMPLIFGDLLDRFTTHANVTGKVLATTDWGPLFVLLSAMYLASGLCWLLVDCTRTLEDTDGASA